MNSVAKKSCSWQRLSYVFSTCMTSTLWTWVLKGIFEYYFLLYCTGYRIYLQHVYIAFVELTLTILSSIFCFKNRNQQSLIMKAAMLLPALVTWYDMIWFCLCKNRQQIPRFWKRWRVVPKDHIRFWNHGFCAVFGKMYAHSTCDTMCNKQLQWHNT